MAHSPLSTLRIGAVAVAAVGALAVPSIASASTLAPATTSAYNSTPNCPVSATSTVCTWDVPVDSTNLFTAADYGQCPYWAVEKYPSLVLNELSSDPLTNDWDGGTWAEHAQQEGLTVNTTPASGDLAVWQPTSSDPVGHVAYVEAVVSGGIVVSQMDGNSQAPFPALHGTTEFISTDNLTYFQQTYGLSYIQTGSASSTPLNYVYNGATATAAYTASPYTESSSTSPSANGASTPMTITVKQLTPKTSPSLAARKAAEQRRAKRIAARRAAAKRAAARRAAERRTSERRSARIHQATASTHAH